MTISCDQMATVMHDIFAECQRMRDAGQKEYAHDVDNALGNFERTAAQTGVSREKVLLVFLLKHIDGISAHVKGHTSQRENVRGRIYDAITYMCLLHGMLDDDAEQGGGDQGGGPRRETLGGGRG